jgi:hypothetical protein
MTQINKKYELIALTKKDLKNKLIKSLTKSGKTLYRIKALRDFSDVKAGDIGGFVESENNLCYDLSCDGKCWIYDDAIAMDNARVVEHAKVCNNAIVKDNASVWCYAEVRDNTIVQGFGRVQGFVCIYGDAIIDTWVSGYDVIITFK